MPMFSGGFFKDINAGYESAMHYSFIDRFTVKVLWWHFLSFVLLAFTVSYFRIAEHMPSPFSWRVISYQEAVTASGIALAASLVPMLLRGKVPVHYHYRLLITLALIVYSYLFVFITGGAIEAHFHFFIVMGYIAMYADWRLGWFALLLTAIHHIALDFLAPTWVFFYGHNLLSPLAHSIPVMVMAYFMTVLCNTHRAALIAQVALEKRKDDFIGIASHELKTPLTSIKTYVQILRLRHEKTADADTKHFLSRIDEQVNKLTLLIKELLDVSRIKSGKLEFHTQQFAFDPFIKEIVQDLQAVSNSHVITINGKANTTLRADKDRIGQVLINLINNAIVYSPKKKKVIVRVAKKNRSILVSVQDFGVGIADEDQEKIFDRFYQAHQGNGANSHGLGLGLSIAQEIITRHGGKIWVQSQLGKGATFTFSLPR